MLGGAWLLTTLLLVLAAAVLRQVPLLLVALLFFLASGAARLWARYSLERVEYKRRLNTDRAFFGDTVTLEVSLANRKMLPLPWVQIEDEVPEALDFVKGKTAPSHKAGRVLLPNLLAMGWYQRVSRRYSVQCLKRGFFIFGPATIRSGDLFGFFDRTAEVEEPSCLLVYPRIVPLEDLGIPSRDPFGDLRIRKHLFEDPVLVASIRDYAHGDSLKRLHWKASAHVGRLQSRVFERTTTADLALFLDTRTALHWGVSEQRLETAVIAAASIASFALGKGYRVGLYANESYRYTGRAVRLPPSAHPEQMQRILEALAHIQGAYFPEIDRVVNREAPALPWGATIVILAAAPTDLLLATINRFRRAGRRVVLIAIGEEASRQASAGIPTYHVSDRVYWREMASVRAHPALFARGGI